MAGYCILTFAVSLLWSGRLQNYWSQEPVLALCNLVGFCTYALGPGLVLYIVPTTIQSLIDKIKDVQAKLVAYDYTGKLSKTLCTSLLTLLDDPAESEVTFQNFTNKNKNVNNRLYPGNKDVFVDIEHPKLFKKAKISILYNLETFRGLPALGMFDINGNFFPRTVKIMFLILLALIPYKLGEIVLLQILKQK